MRASSLHWLLQLPMAKALQASSLSPVQTPVHQTKQPQHLRQRQNWDQLLQRLSRPSLKLLSSWKPQYLLPTDHQQ